MLSNRLDIKKTIILAWPVILGQLSHIALGVTDTLMVGKLGVTPLAAAALANSYFVLPLTFCFGLASAIAPLAAKYRAQDNEYLNGALLFNGFLSLLAFGLFFCVFLLLGKIFLPYLNQPENVVEESLAYIDYLAVSVVPIAIYLHFKNFIEGFEWMMPALWIGVASIPINALLNYIFIYGHFGVPAYGLEGAGIATLLTRSSMLIVILMVIFKSKLRNFLFLSLRLRWNSIKKVLSIGIPAGTQYVFEAGAFVISALFMGMLGEKELAAHQVAINIASVPFMISIGISAAASIRMGNLLGNSNWPQIRITGRNIIIITTALMVVTSTLLAIGYRWIPTLYIDHQEVLRMASHMLIIAAIFQISDGVQAVLIGLLRGLEDVVWPTAFTLIAYWIIAIPLGAYLGFRTDLNYMGIWLGLLIGLSISATMMILRFNYITKRKRSISS